jgi:hypothetical protein
MTRQMRRVLVVAHEHVESEELHGVIREQAVTTRGELLVLGPARAEEDVVRSVERLRLSGFDVEGIVGCADPDQAIADALALFEADVVVIATGASGPGLDLAGRARRRFGLPIVHVVIGDALHVAA